MRERETSKTGALIHSRDLQFFFKIFKYTSCMCVWYITEEEFLLHERSRNTQLHIIFLLRRENFSTTSPEFTRVHFLSETQRTGSFFARIFVWTHVDKHQSLPVAA
jgi:hypothetical protein